MKSSKFIIMCLMAAPLSAFAQNSSDLAGAAHTSFAMGAKLQNAQYTTLDECLRRNSILETARMSMSQTRSENVESMVTELIVWAWQNNTAAFTKRTIGFCASRNQKTRFFIGHRNDKWTLLGNLKSRYGSRVGFSNNRPEGDDFSSLAKEIVDSYMSN